MNVVEMLEKANQQLMLRTSEGTITAQKLIREGIAVLKKDCLVDVEIEKLSNKEEIIKRRRK